MQYKYFQDLYYEMLCLKIEMKGLNRNNNFNGSQVREEE